jgi:hypothetical protein
MYDGSVSDLVMALIDNEKTSEKELAILKETVKKLSGPNKK